MKIYLALILLLTITAGAFGHTPAKAPLSIARQFVVKKQQLVDDFELQLKDIPYAAVRIYIRYKLAEWLWKKGKDDTDRAEALAVKALEEIYARREELANSHRFKLVTDIFALLDTNAKETSIKLKAKYDFAAEEDLFSGFSQLTKKDGDEAVAQKLIKALNKPGDINNMINPLLNSLRTMKSPQFPIVLGAFLDAVESGRVNANNGTLYMFVMHFSDPQASPSFRARYFNLIVARARIATQTPDPIVYPMLTAAIASLGEGSDLLPEAMGLKNALAITESAASKARREAQERIDASTDKVAALIEEAERAENAQIKISFYMQAVIEARNTGKFTIAIDLIGKLKELDKRDSRNDWADSEFTTIAKRALDKDEVEIAMIATDRIEEPVDHAEALKTAAEYFDRKKEAVAAREAISKMLKLLANRLEEGEDGLRANTLVRTLPLIQKADKITLPEAIAITAKAINDQSTPGAEDKPGTDKFANYVFNTMWLNYSVTTMTAVLSSHDKTDARDLSERIQRREVRIVADLVLATDALDAAQKEAEKKAAEKLKTPATPKH
jgi:hypothetical protein